MSLVELAFSAPIATITLNRPEKRNALSPDLLRQLASTLDTVNERSDIRAVILEGNGPAFCAGADLAYLQQLAQFSILENMEDSALLQTVFYKIFTFPKPVIAKVHGPAIAGGCGLATVCDIVVAGREKAIFGYSEVSIGFIAAIVMVYLLRKVGDTTARRLLLTAERISAEEAHRMGLVSYVVPDDQLDRFTTELAQKIARNSASALRLTKQMLQALHGMSLEAGLQYAVSMNALTRMTDDCQSGIQRFLNRSR